MGIYQLPLIEKPCKKSFSPNRVWNTRYFSNANNRLKIPLKIRPNFS